MRRMERMPGQQQLQNSYCQTANGKQRLDTAIAKCIAETTLPHSRSNSRADWFFFEVRHDGLDAADPKVI